MGNSTTDSQPVTRRQVLQAAAGASVALALTGCSTPEGRPAATAPAEVPAPAMAVDLTGDTWTMHEDGQADKIAAIVPGATYTDLMRAGKIPNPYYREDNGKVQWVAEKNWIYERTFDVPAEMLSKPHVELKCHGLDTLAAIWINDREVGRTDNMFRDWSFDVRSYLKPGGNTIRIKFDTLTPYVESNRQAYKEAYGIDLSDARSWVRKAPYMWGWDWCRAVLTQGIWKPIEILAYDARITDLGILQHHDASGSVHLNIQTTVAGANSGAQVTTRVLFGDQLIATASAPVKNGLATCHVDVANPKLWWPNGMGDHPLYVVESRLYESAGSVVEVLAAGTPSTAKVIDTARHRIGLRKIEVVSPTGAVAMHVKVNGVPVFVKGADWIPADNIPTRVTPETLRWYMKKAIECHFNFIRLWGGGYYEQDELFDLCDELGIMLQFEFKFANDTYPVNDRKWMANLQAELDQQVLRCRNHPSIVIWSGNNEIQDFKGYYHLFRDVIGGTVHRLLPGAFYEVGSGAAGSGDIHTWEVWHAMAPFEQFRTVEGFVTEFGMQSFPVPMTVDAYTDAADRQSVHSPVMRYHELDGSGHGVGIIMHYTNMYFGRSPENFDDTLWLTQINQAYGIRYGVEHWRRDMPRSMAATIWQYNDCWPGPTWSMTDYYRRFKAIQYQSKHFFAPILVSGIPDPTTGKAELYITSDRQKDVSGELRWVVTDMAGAVLKQGEMPVHIPARTSRLAHTLNLADLISSHGAGNLLIWPEVRVGSRTVAENALFFGRPVELKFHKPQLALHVSGSGQHYDLRIDANAPALWAFADVKDTPATYSDNFVAIRPGRTAVIHITLDEPMSPAEFHGKLTVRSIYDLAPDMRA